MFLSSQNVLIRFSYLELNLVTLTYFIFHFSNFLKVRGKALESEFSFYEYNNTQEAFQDFYLCEF